MEKETITAQVADVAQNTIQVTEAASTMSFWELATHSGPLAFGVLILLIELARVIGWNT